MGGASAVAGPDREPGLFGEGDRNVLSDKDP